MTTNSPNPVDGDVQALIEKEMDAFEKWFLSYRTDWDKESVYRFNYKNGPGFASAYIQAMWLGWSAHKKSTPPAQLLRSVELPAISAGKYYTEEGVFMAFDYKRDLNAAIRAAGGEVKND